MKKENSLVIVMALAVTLFLIIGNSMWLNKVQVEGEEYEPIVFRPGNNGLLNLPGKIYGTVGAEITVFYQNLLKESITEDVQLKIAGEQTGFSPSQKSFGFTPTAKGSTAFEQELYKAGELVAVQKTEIVANEMRTTPIKGLILGDSTVKTNGKGYVTNRIKENLGDNVEFIGTMGTGSNKFEGRGGWTAAKYRTNEEYEGKRNPFYNPEKEDFDFEYYMTNQEFENLDFVILNLGINDTFSYKNSTDLINNYNAILANFDHIINSIKEYDKEIKIGVNLTIPPSSSQELFTQDFGVNSSQVQAKENNFLWVQKLISYYRFSDNVDLVPIYLGIDTENHFENSIHPNLNGYNQIGDQITAYLNSL